MTETICRCGDKVRSFQFHEHSRCDYVYKIPDSDIECHCLKFPNHKGKHIISVIEVDDD